MERVNVHGYNPIEEKTVLEGWFDRDAATENVAEDANWDGNNWVGVMSRIPTDCGGERLYRTAGGRWVRHLNARNYYNGPYTFEFISDADAMQWLLCNNRNEVFERYFGPISAENGPGQDRVGPPVHVYLGDTLNAVDEYATKRSISRDQAAHELVTAGLATAPDLS